MMQARSLALVLLAGSVWFPQALSGQPRPAPSKGVTMNNERTNLAAEVLRLAGDEFFALSEPRRLELANRFSEIAGDDAATDPAATPPCLVLGAPGSVDLKARGRLPVLLGTFETALRGWAVNLKPNLNLYVKSRTTGQMLHSTPLISVRRGQQPLPSGGGAAPTGGQAAATRASMVVIDLLDRMGGHLNSGDEISVTAVAFDARSNTVRIRLEGPDKPGAPVAVKHPYVRSELDPRPSIEPEIVVPSQGSAKSGWKIRVAKQLTADDGVLRTELNQPFLPAHIILVRLDKPATVIPASPLVQQVALPDGKQVFNALFLVEIGGEKGHAVAPGAYQVYLDLGASFLGPYPLQVSE
jgi:hypothetical protein